jgi:type III restriction enzyme
MIVEYDGSLVAEISARLELRDPNRDALEAIAKALSASPIGSEFVCDLATGVGKTWIAAGLVDYLAAQGVRNILFVSPGKTILTKTVDNFSSGNPRTVQGLSANLSVITAEDFALGTVASDLTNGDVVKLFVFNVQQLIKPTSETSRKVRSVDENLGKALYDHLRDSPDLVVIADEHHCYFGPSFSEAVRELNASAIVGLTATPHEKTPQEQIIFKYSLAAAIADKFVKIPVIVARHDGQSDVRTQLTDGLKLLHNKKINADKYAHDHGTVPVNPVMLVVCPTINDATEAAEILVEPGMITHQDGVLLITGQSSDQALALLDEVEQPSSPVRAIVSVDKLKEGWDVKNIYVICALRALESKALTEQILGRGLRLPYGTRTNNKMLDTVDIVSHRKFRDLLKNKDLLLEIIQVQEPGAPQKIAEVPLQTTLPVADLVPAISEGSSSIEMGNVIDQAKFGGAESFPLSGSSINDWMQQGIEASTEPVKLLKPLEGAPSIEYPKQIVSIKESKFTLSEITDAAMTTVGNAFVQNTAVKLDRIALEAHRNASGVVRIEQKTYQSETAVQQNLSLNDLRENITAMVMKLEIVEQTQNTFNATKRLVKAFLTGAGVKETDVWTKDRCERAVEAIRQRINGAFEARPSERETKIETVIWPPAVQPWPTGEVVDQSTLIVNKKMGVKGKVLTGWQHSILPAVCLDARSTEYEIARILDNAFPTIQWWARIPANNELSIPYSKSSRYNPDFIAIGNDGTNWVIEGKADDDAHDSDVLAKKTAAENWARQVRDDDFHGVWRYLFATETNIKNANGDWATLVEIAQPEQ